jgi:hypothetical protein
MRVTIENISEERDRQRAKSVFNLFSSAGKVTDYVVRVSIELSEKERAILAHHHLWEVSLMMDEFRVPRDWLEANPILHSQVGQSREITIANLINGYDGQPFTRRFSTPVDAKNFEVKLRNDAFPKLKRYIEDSNVAGQPSKDTFEL